MPTRNRPLQPERYSMGSEDERMATGVSVPFAELRRFVPGKVEQPEFSLDIPRDAAELASMFCSDRDEIDFVVADEVQEVYLLVSCFRMRLEVLPSERVTLLVRSVERLDDSPWS